LLNVPVNIYLPQYSDFLKVVFYFVSNKNLLLSKLSTYQQFLWAWLGWISEDGNALFIRLVPIIHSPNHCSHTQRSRQPEPHLRTHTSPRIWDLGSRI